MEKNPLFKGLTRPPMIFGVPMTPFVIAMGSIILVAFYSQNIFLVGFSIPVFFIMKAMTKRDDFIFRLMFLKMRFFSNPASKNYYKAKTYSTNSYRQMPPNSNFPKISVFGLNAEPNFEKLIPFSSLINDSVVITKDYLLMTTWEIGGISFEAEDDDELDIKNDLLNMLFKSFANEPVSFYFHNCRYSIEDKLTSKFNNAFLEEIDRKYYESFKQGTLRKNSLYLTLIFNPLKVKSGILSYYILWRVMSLADGRRLCIDIDEAWKWLENEIVQEEVKNKFKTIRKQNGFLRLATQSVEDFLKLKNAATLIEQSATMVFLPNPKAKEEEYVNGIGLSYDEYMIIKGFNPAKRQFLIKRQDEKVICTLDLSSLGSENLKILSTGTAHIDTIEKIFSQENKSLDEKVLELKEFYKNS
ncbi:VirB3 family type IV secretion system protein [Campylobacter coli]